jgi:hypothetical protein
VRMAAPPSFSPALAGNLLFTLFGSRLLDWRNFYIIQMG